MVRKVSMKQLVGGGYDQAWKDRSFWMAWMGSRASKKSTTAAFRWIYLIMRDPWSNLLVVRQYSNTNRDSTFSQLKKAIYELGVEDYWKINSTLPMLTYIPTGQAILFRGMDKPLKLTSIGVDRGVLNYVWIEEAFQIESWDAVQTLGESIRGNVDDPNFFNQILFTLNPWSEKHWIKSKFFDEETRVPNSSSYITTYKDNEFLAPEVVGRMETLYVTDPRRAKIALDANWGISEGLVFENQFTAEDLSNLDTTGMTEAVGMDFGWAHDPTVITKSYIDFETMTIYVTDSWVKKLNASTNDIWNGAVQLGVNKVRADADPQEGRLVAQLQQMGWKQLYVAPKGKGSVASGVQFMKDFTWVIDPKNELILDEFNSYHYKMDSEDNLSNEPADESNHSIDALRYSIIKHIGLPRADQSAMSKENIYERFRRIPGL